jgi:ribose transport system substrate-binding protein
VEIEWKGPQNESDTTGQINIVENFVARRVDGIVLAPNDSSALVGAVRLAGKQEKPIPVVIFDSDLDDKDAYVSYVATDNKNGGALAARRLAEALGVTPTKKTGENAKSEKTKED